MHSMRVPTGWPIVGWAAAVVMTMVAVFVWQYGLGEEGFRVVLRATARTSLVLFLAAFLASSIRRLSHAPFADWMLRNRRQLGVGFAVSHTIHGWAIVSLVRLGFEVNVLTLVAGGFGYALIAAMVLTSFDRTAAWLGPRAWRTLHATGIWYLWILFTVTYLVPAFSDPLAAVSLGALFAALGVRIAARRRPAA